ncbi:MAG: hypothetical protein KUG72_04090 [Pseudomonadales bacterium]|nr:hypothetical protein [Pseudomonadales bacterium]
MKLIEQLTIATRYCGPPDSANGGYVAGLLAKSLRATSNADQLGIQVRLLAPPPLEQPLDLYEMKSEQGELGALLQMGQTEIAVATLVPALSAPPAAPTVQQAEAAMAGFDGSDHPFPGCFVCGPGRDPADALCIYPGGVSSVPPTEKPMVASTWQVDANYCDDNGVLKTEILCAALDCPSSFGILEVPTNKEMEPMVLASFTFMLSGDLKAGEQAIAVGWAESRKGRKAFGGSAIYNSAGQCVAHAEALWISLNRGL